MTSRSRGWCFTINNYSAQDIDLLLDLHFDYLIMAFETGAKGTAHIQGYVHWDNARSFNSVKLKLPKKTHIEKQKGTCDQAIIYCMKDGEFYEFGDRPQPGKAKFELIQEVMKDPESNFHLYQQYRKTYVQYMREKNTPDERFLYFLHEDLKYDRQDDTIHMSSDIDTYDGESAIIIHPYHSFNVIDWFHGYAPKIKRGYEIIKVDPKVVYILYSNEKELNYLKKKYLTIVYHGILSKETEQLQEEVEAYAQTV